MTRLREVPSVDREKVETSEKDGKSAGSEPAAQGEPGNPSTFEEWVMPYVEDSTLWPVLLVVIVHMMAFIAPVMLLAVRDRLLGPFLTLGILGGLSVWVFVYDWRVRQRPGPFSWIVVSCWLGSLVMAYYADLHDFF
jgi:hypothetical protein